MVGRSKLQTHQMVPVQHWVVILVMHNEIALSAMHACLLWKCKYIRTVRICAPEASLLLNCKRPKGI